jgi:transcriptional regulator with XRE-family HTH domain
MAIRNGLSVQQKVGQRIKQLRAEMKISQEKLGLKAGLDRTYINSVENGRRNISIRAIFQISSALNSSLKEFFSSDLFEDGE